MILPKMPLENFPSELTLAERSEEELISYIRAIRRERARQNILLFLDYYLSHIKENATPEFHKEIYQLLKTEKRLGLAAPRGFAKSTTVDLVYTLHCLLFNRGEDILLISASSQMAEDWLRKIKSEFDNNERIKEDFGGVLTWGEGETSKWTNNHIVVERNGSVFSQLRARGRGCQVRGLRPTKVFCDDLEDEELTRSEEQRKFLKQWFLGALLNVLSVNQQLIVIGTILHPLALLSDIVGKKDEFVGWTTKKYTALNLEGESLWQDRFSVEFLQNRKKEIGTYAFEAEYQNNPITSDICLWKSEWLVDYQSLPEIKDMYTGIDPATSTKESADYTGLVCWGIGTDNRIYEIESVKGRWGTWDFIEQILNHFIKYKSKLRKIGTEKEKIEQVIKPVLLVEARKRGLYPPLQSIEFGSYREGEKRASRDKFSRAMTVIHLFEQDIVRLKPKSILKEQLLTFPTGSEDDLVDAAVHGLHLIIRYSGNVKVIKTLRETRNIVNSFEVKDNTIPCFAPPPGTYRTEDTGDWRT